jgi:glycosyltransferase involved in cell wall biosynthesis
MIGSLKALIVAYSFPPVGGAGVQRVLKLTKYLPDHGIRPAVLTVSNPSVPVLDPSLARDFPPGLEVVRARTFEPGYGTKQVAWTAAAGTDAASRPSLSRSVIRCASGLARNLLVPDPQILWQPGAQAALARRLARRQDDVVFVSGPPFSQFLLAPLVRLRRSVAVVLDYRDEWTTCRTMYEMRGGASTRQSSDPIEPALLRCAHAVTTATEEFREALLGRFPFLDPARVVAIPNGYDPDDFPPALPEPPPDRLSVTYAGTIFKLTSARGLLGAVRRLHSRSPALARRLSLRFAGRIADTELPLFDGMAALGVQRLGYVPHDQVLGVLAESHLVLCLLDDVPGVERIYPAKIFELMHLGRPILTLSPPGALTRLLERHRLGTSIPPRDEAAIAAFLEARLREQAEGRLDHRLHAQGIKRYHRRALAGEIACVMREAASRAVRS